MFDCPEMPAGLDRDGWPEDPAALRADFPQLAGLVRGRPLVYLDNAATTQKPASVIRGECEYYGTCNANIHRAIHHLGEEATRRYEEVRSATAAFLGAAAPESIVFTRGTTESINLVARGWAARRLGPGDEILATEMEHHSNLVPWQQAAAACGAALRLMPVAPDGRLDPEAWPRMIGPRTRLVALPHVSNVLGTVNPVREIAAAAHRAGARVLVDGAQGVPHLPVRVDDLDCDFLAFSAHKMCGPTGVGILYGRPDALAETEPLLHGGEMIARVEFDRATWAEVPRRFEGGTPNIAGVIGFGWALAYLGALGMERVRRRDAELTGYALERLRGVPGLRVVGEAPERGALVSFDVAGVHPHDLAQFLDREGIAIRSGHMCAQPLLRKLGFPALNRASFYFYNLEREIDALAEAIGAARRYFA